MNRRNLLASLAALPFIGSMFKAKAERGFPYNVRKTPEIFGTDVSRLFVYAWSGETVTCENGHPICDFARTVLLGDIQNPSEDFCNWRQEEPTVGQLPLPRCAVCGGEFVKGGMVYHVGKFWRDPYGYIEAYNA